MVLLAVISVITDRFARFGPIPPDAIDPVAGHTVRYPRSAAAICTATQNGSR